MPHHHVSADAATSVDTALRHDIAQRDATDIARPGAGPRQSRASVSTARRSFAWGLRAILLIALLPFGSTGAFALPLATLATAVLLCLSVSIRPGFRPTLRLQGATTAIAVLVGGYVVLQATGAGSLLPVHPIWATAGSMLGRQLGAVAAVDPATALASIPAILAPLLYFVACLRVLRDDAMALAALRFVALVGGLVAFFGLVQFVVSPDTVLFADKVIYRDSLTAVFVNRNSAATYLGCTMLLLIGIVRIHIGPRSLAVAFNDLLPDVDGASGDWRLAGWLFLLGVTVLALFLTKSRAGIGCSAAALAFMVLVSFDGGHRSGRASWRTGRLVALLLTGAAIAAAVFALGGQTLFRAQIGGFDDPRFCVLPALLQAARDNWPVGTGPGTFDVVFQPLRDPSCGLYRAWDRAHNFFLEGTIALGAMFWIAVIPACLFLVSAFVHGIRTRRRLRAVPAVGLACLVLLSTHGLVDFSIQIEGIAMNASLIFAACATVALARNRAGLRQDRA